MAAKPSSHETTDHLAESLHHAVDSAAERAGPAEERVRAQAARAADKARESADYARTRSREVASSVGNYVQENPLMALGIAFAAGTLVSSLLRRR
jgi:ElaB/YqjD/DUF883 family membrane-anchored ribosome-binding protein